MSETTPQNASGADLDWVAFCYIAGELSDEDRTLFEVRLENDLTACEAVSRAVQLADTTCMALADSPLATDSPRSGGEESTAPSKALDLSRRARSIGVAALIASVLILVLSVLQYQSDSVAVNETVQDADAIVGLWTSTQSVVTGTTESAADVEPLPRDVVVALPVTTGPSVLASTELSVDVPDWLMVAVLAESASDESETWEN